MSILQDYLKDQFLTQSNYGTVNFLRYKNLSSPKNYPNIDTIKTRSYSIATIDEETNNVHYFNFQVLKIKPGSNNYLSFYANTDMEEIFKQVLSENDFNKLDKFTDFFTNREMYQNIVFAGHVWDNNSLRSTNIQDLTWVIKNNFEKDKIKTISVNNYTFHLVPNFLSQIATNSRLSLIKSGY